MRSLFTYTWGVVRRGPLGRAWDSIREPRHAKAVYTLAFLAAVGMGASAIASPPLSIEGVLGLTLTYTWGAFLLVGGIMGALATIPGWWAIERLGIFSLGLGVAIYSLVVIYLQFTSGGNRLPQWFALIAVILLWIPEVQRIKGYSFEPRG